jgi:hypothetical protein
MATAATAAIRVDLWRAVGIHLAYRQFCAES